MALTSSTALALAWSSSTNKTMSSSFLFLSLYLVSIGQGAYNPSLQAFGADQLDDDEDLPCSKNENKSHKKSTFFQWWYFGVCSGSLLGVTVMSYIQDTFGWVLGFAIPMTAMVTSVAFFCCGRRMFIYKQNDAIFSNPFESIVQAFKAAKSKFMHCEVKLSNYKADKVELE